MVGARNASAAACRFARQLAHGLGDAGSVIVSGLARGIDTAAHDGAFDTGTIAVIAGGIDVFYPPENEARQRAIAESGAAGRRAAARRRAARAPFSLSQPDHRRPRRGHGGDRGRAQIRLADHRPLCRRVRPRGDGGARLAARSARAGLQPADPRRRDLGPERGGRAGGAAPARRRAGQAGEGPTIRRASRPRSRKPRGPAYWTCSAPRRSRSTNSSASPASPSRWCRPCCWSLNWPAGWSGTPEGG